MKKSIYTMLSISLLGASLSAQSAVDQVDRAERQRSYSQSNREVLRGETVSELYEGEMEDIGPQFLLVGGKPKHQWLSFFSDLQFWYTDNGTLDSSNEVSSTVTVATAQLNVTAPKREWKGGELIPTLGFRYQVFRYGYLDDDDATSNGVVVDSQDFDARSVFADLGYQRGNWYYKLGLRYQSLVQAHGTVGESYREWAPNWLVNYTHEFPSSTVLNVSYDGSWRDTKTETFGGVVDTDFEDRIDNAFTIGLSRVYFDRWLLQPSYRFQYSDYQEDSRSRSDKLHSLSTTVSYQWNERVALRTFVSYEKRTSDEVGVDHAYNNFNAGLGGSFVYQF